MEYKFSSFPKEEKPLCLVVENAPEPRWLLEIIVNTIGYQVVSASSGEDAVYQIETKRPPLILLNLHLPDMSGLKVLKIAKRLDPQSQIVVITNSLNEDFREEAKNLGVETFLDIPLKVNKIVTTLRNIKLS